jgi:predicted PurR-regulated permease PerM
MVQPVLDDAGRGDPPRHTVQAALNAGAVVVAALYFGQDLFVPLVLAGLLAFVLAPAVGLLERAFLPRGVAVVMAVLLAFSVIFLLGDVVARQISHLVADLPQYEATVEQKWHDLADGSAIMRNLLGAEQGAPHAGLVSTFSLNGATALSLAGRFAQPILGPVANAGVVLIFTLFILLYSEDLRDRFVRLVGRRDLHRTIFAMNDAGRRLSRYFLFQLILNASFGIWIGLLLLVLGLRGAVLWGIFAMLMRFVPFVGTILALLPALAIAIATAPGWTLAILVLVLFVGSELIMGQVVEPQIYGHSTGLSPIAVIVATAFWALLWGLVGLLLATPLTVCLVVLGRHVETLSFFDVIFGDTSPLLPAETFYQRALEGRSLTLLREARAQIAGHALAEYYDKVALAGLVLAQADRVHDTLAFERQEAVHDQVEQLVAALAHAAPVGGADAPAAPAWREPGAVLCLPGRGQLDDLAATMAAQVLRQAGFGARMTPNLVLDGEAGESVDFAGVRLCCLSVFEAGASAAGIRYFLRRMGKKMPNARLVVGLWQAAGTSPLLTELRADDRDEHLVLSIGELSAFTRAISAQKDTALA